jgi:hypothetical protein
MKNLILSLALLLTVYFTQAQASLAAGSVTTTTNCALSGSTVTVTLSTVPMTIPGKTNYTFQVYFGDGSYEVANTPLYSTDTSFTTTHTYTEVGTYTITYILGYADLQNAGPAGLELVQSLRTVNINAVTTGVHELSPDSKTAVFCNNKQLTVKSEDQIAEIQIFNTAGQLVQGLKPNTSGTLNIPLSSSLESGIYMVSVKNNEDQTVSTKVFVN